MKKNLFILTLLLCVTFGASAQKKFNLYAVGFYNQENLFDTCHDEGATTTSCLTAHTNGTD